MTQWVDRVPHDWNDSKSPVQFLLYGASQ